MNKLLKTETQLVSTNFVRLLNPLFLSWSFLKLSSFKFKLYLKKKSLDCVLFYCKARRNRLGAREPDKIFTFGLPSPIENEC